MALSIRTILLAAATALAGAGAVSSAPVPAVPQARIATDDAFKPGSDGVDLAAITGPRGSAQGRLPACADPARRGDLRPC